MCTYNKIIMYYVSIKIKQIFYQMENVAIFSRLSIPTIFSKEIQENNKTEAYEELIARLYQKIGQLEVKLEWLKKNLSFFLS